ncbi:MAG: hypothetical protein WBL21_12785, partial [Salinimicrobium sp.]
FGGASSETQFVGANPSSQAKLMYFLKKRHTFGKMSMDIMDSNGNIVASPAPGKSKGLNIVKWDYHQKVPKVAVGKVPSFVVAPRVLAGDYKVLITKGKDSHEHMFSVKNDPASNITAAEREENRKLTLRLFDAVEDLAYLGYRIDTYVKALEKTDSKNAKKMSSELTDLKSRLVVTTGDRYVQEAEDELREKLNDLYNQVAQSFDKPAPVHYINADEYEKQLQAAWDDLKKMEKKYASKMNKELEKAEKKSIDLKTKEEFLAE